MIHLYFNENLKNEIRDLFHINYSLNPYNTQGRNLFYLAEKITTPHRVNLASFNIKTGITF